MKWEDYIDTRNPNAVQLAERITDIECPECGDWLYQDVSIVLASNPPQLRYHCKKCGWSGTE